MRGIYVSGRETGKGGKQMTPPKKSWRQIVTCSDHCFYTFKEGALQMWTCPSLLWDGNWSIKCWKSIMYLGRWNRLTYWRLTVSYLVDKAGQLRHIVAVKLCPKGVRHRGSHILMYLNFTERKSVNDVLAVYPGKKSYLKIWLCYFACWMIRK